SGTPSPASCGRTAAPRRSRPASWTWSSPSTAVGGGSVRACACWWPRMRRHGPSTGASAVASSPSSPGSAPHATNGRAKRTRCSSTRSSGSATRSPRVNSAISGSPSSRPSTCCAPSSSGASGRSSFPIARPSGISDLRSGGLYVSPDDGSCWMMIGRRFVRGTLLSHTRRRVLGAIMLTLGSLSLPLSDQPAAAADVPPSTAPSSDALPNYGVIWEGKLTRSGQPSAEGWRWLRRQGVRSLVSFRGEDNIDDRVRFRHALWVPFTKRTPPTDDEAEEFLTFVRDPSHWPLHIHCEHGRDRTGLMAALVRYAIDAWSLARALAAAR